MRFNPTPAPAFGLEEEEADEEEEEEEEEDDEAAADGFRVESVVALARAPSGARSSLTAFRGGVLIRLATSQKSTKKRCTDGPAMTCGPLLMTIVRRDGM